MDRSDAISFLRHCPLQVRQSETSGRFGYARAELKHLLALYEKNGRPSGEEWNDILVRVYH
jgi:hypothetical protein